MYVKYHQQSFGKAGGVYKKVWRRKVKDEFASRPAPLEFISFMSTLPKLPSFAPVDGIPFELNPMLPPPGDRDLGIAFNPIQRFFLEKDETLVPMAEAALRYGNVFGGISCLVWMTFKGTT